MYILKWVFLEIAQIEAIEIENIDGQINVYLEDLKEGTITELNTNPVYEFIHSFDSDPHRFNFHFKESWYGVEDNDYAILISIQLKTMFT